LLATCVRKRENPEPSALIGAGKSFRLVAIQKNGAFSASLLPKKSWVLKIPVFFDGLF